MSTASASTFVMTLSFQPANGAPASPPPGRTETIGAPTGLPGAGNETKQLVPGGPNGSSQQPPPPGGGWIVLLLPVLLLVGLMVFGSMSQKKEQRRRRELLASVQRNDRVQTIGGVIGTVVEIDEEELVLRVDETTNTRVRFARAAVQQVLRKAGGGGGGANSQAEAKPSGVKASV